MPPWTVQAAKAQLSELLRRARAGEPQQIGVSDVCVLVSEKEWAALNASNLGVWLAENAPRGAEMAAPTRGSRRGDPFAERAEPAARKRK